MLAWFQHLPGFTETVKLKEKLKINKKYRLRTPQSPNLNIAYASLLSWSMAFDWTA